jgi:hypothetical protein
MYTFDLDLVKDGEASTEFLVGPFGHLVFKLVEFVLLRSYSALGCPASKG